MDPVHGALGGVWKPHPGLSLLGRGLLDLILPPRAHDGAPSQGPGLSPAAWSRITFVDGPVCDGCGGPFGFESGQAVRCATGATAEGCARALLAAGAAQVSLAVVACVSEMRARPI